MDAANANSTFCFFGLLALKNVEANCVPQKVVRAEGWA